MSGYRVAIKDVYPDMTPAPKAGEGRSTWFDRWFGEDEAAARSFYDSCFDGDAILYFNDDSLADLGKRVLASKSGTLS